MAATFTTWSALYTTMLNTLADFVTGKITIAEYSISSGGNLRRMSYRSFEEFKAGLEYVKHMADQESGTVVRRTYAKQGGGGRW